MSRHADEGAPILAPDEPAALRLSHRLCRVEGQVRGIGRMICNKRGCTEVLQQLAAAQRALDEVALALLEAEVRRHVAALAAGPWKPESMEDIVPQVMAAVSRLVRSR